MLFLPNYTPTSNDPTQLLRGYDQYGLPKEEEGIFIEITDIPARWYDHTRVNIYQQS